MNRFDLKTYRTAAAKKKATTNPARSQTQKASSSQQPQVKATATMTPKTRPTTAAPLSMNSVAGPSGSVGVSVASLQHTVRTKAAPVQPSSVQFAAGPSSVAGSQAPTSSELLRLEYERIRQMQDQQFRYQQAQPHQQQTYFRAYQGPPATGHPVISQPPGPTPSQSIPISHMEQLTQQFIQQLTPTLQQMQNTLLRRFDTSDEVIRDLRAQVSRLLEREQADQKRKELETEGLKALNLIAERLKKLNTEMGSITDALGRTKGDNSLNDQGQSVMDRLRDLKMDVQEWLERTRDPEANLVPETTLSPGRDSPRPIASFVVPPVVRHEMATSPIKPKYVDAATLVTSPISSNLPLPILLEVNTPTEATSPVPISGQIERYLHNASQSRSNSPTTSRQFSGHTLVDDVAMGDTTMSSDATKVAGVQSTPNRSDAASSSDKILDVDLNHDLDNLFSSLPAKGADSLSKSKSNGDSDYVDMEVDTIESTPLDATSLTNTQSASVVQAWNAEVQLSTPSRSTRSLTSRCEATIGERSVRRSGRPKTPYTLSAFSPVDWSKTVPDTINASSNDTRRGSLSPRKTTHVPPPLHDSPTPSRSYTLPTPAEGTIADLRQQALGDLYMFSPVIDSRSSPVKEVGTVGAGAEAAQRMLSPESQFAYDDEEEMFSPGPVEPLAESSAVGIRASPASSLSSLTSLPSSSSEEASDSSASEEDEEVSQKQEIHNSEGRIRIALSQTPMSSPIRAPEQISTPLSQPKLTFRLPTIKTSSPRTPVSPLKYSLPLSNHRPIGSSPLKQTLSPSSGITEDEEAVMSLVATASPMPSPTPSTRPLAAAHSAFQGLDATPVELLSPEKRGKPLAMEASLSDLAAPPAGESVARLREWHSNRVKSSSPKADGAGEMDVVDTLEPELDQDLEYGLPPTDPPFVPFEEPTQSDEGTDELPPSPHYAENAPLTEGVLQIQQVEPAGEDDADHRSTPVSPMSGLSVEILEIASDLQTTMPSTEAAPPPGESITRLREWHNSRAKSSSPEEDVASDESRDEPSPDVPGDVAEPLDPLPADLMDVYDDDMDVIDTSEPEQDQEDLQDGLPLTDPPLVPFEEPIQTQIELSDEGMDESPPLDRADSIPLTEDVPENQPFEPAGEDGADRRSTPASLVSTLSVEILEFVPNLWTTTQTTVTPTSKGKDPFKRSPSVISISSDSSDDDSPVIQSKRPVGPTQAADRPVKLEPLNEQLTNSVVGRTKSALAPPNDSSDLLTRDLSPISDLSSATDKNSQRSASEEDLAMHLLSSRLEDDEAEIIPMKKLRTVSGSAPGPDLATKVEQVTVSLDMLQPPPPPKKSLLAIKRGQSAAVTRIKKRKPRPQSNDSDEDEDQPPLKRAKQRKTLTEEGQSKSKVENITPKRKEPRIKSPVKPTIKKEMRSPVKTPTRRPREKPARVASVVWPTTENPDFDTFVTCDTCDSWYHVGCVGMRPDDHRLEASELYQCPPCEAGVPKDGKLYPWRSFHSPMKHGKVDDSSASCARLKCLWKQLKTKKAPKENSYVVESFVGMFKKHVGGRGTEDHYLVQWLGWELKDATWEPLKGLNLANPSLLIDKFEEDAASENLDLDGAHNQYVLLKCALDAGWNSDGDFVKRAT